MGQPLLSCRINKPVKVVRKGFLTTPEESWFFNNPTGGNPALSGAGTAPLRGENALLKTLFDKDTANCKSV